MTLYGFSDPLSEPHLRALMMGYWIYPTDSSLAQPRHLLEYLLAVTQIGPIVPGKENSESFKKLQTDIQLYLDEILIFCSLGMF